MQRLLAALSALVVTPVLILAILLADAALFAASCVVSWFIWGAVGDWPGESIFLRVGLTIVLAPLVHAIIRVTLVRAWRASRGKTDTHYEEVR